MRNYIIKRLLLIPITLLGILALNFVIVQFAPGGPVEHTLAKYRGFNVDVGVVEQRTTIDGKTDRKYYEVDFIANLGRKKYYIQSAYDIPSNEKLQQETNSFDRIDDSFKKIIIVNKTIKPRTTEKGYTILGLKDFLLDEKSLDA